MLLTLSLWASCGGGDCEFEPYLPTGFPAGSLCDCPDGVLYYCDNAGTCAGEVGVTTCEGTPAQQQLNRHQFCDGCRAAVRPGGAFYVVCDSPQGAQ